MNAFSDQDIPLNLVTSLLMQFGQFITMTWNLRLNLLSVRTQFFYIYIYVYYLIVLFRRIILIFINLFMTNIIGDGVGFSCCADNNQQLDSSVLECLIHCLPISIPLGDRQLKNEKTGCMNFVRSSTGPNRINCDLPFVSYAEQV